MREISYEEALSLPDPVFVDVRAPVEYRADHIPGAISMPVFDDGERALVGTLYRTHGEEAAILKGTEIAGSKLAGMVADISRMRRRDIVIGCFRGGMRSTTLVSLLDSLGLRVYKLRGGYREYRQYIRRRVEALDIAPALYVLHGLTGAGKTRILRKIANALDLEAMAGHRSSLFGALGLSPNTQKMFESLLVERVDAVRELPYVVVEGESRKIGDIHIPRPLLERMARAPGVLVRAPIERRVRNLLDEYPRDADPGRVRAIVRSLENRTGPRVSRELERLFERGELEEFARLLLEKYYDPLYSYSLDRMTFVAEIENADTDDAVRQLLGIVMPGEIF